MLRDTQTKRCAGMCPHAPTSTIFGGCTPSCGGSATVIQGLKIGSISAAFRFVRQLHRSRPAPAGAEHRRGAVTPGESGINQSLTMIP